MACDAELLWIQVLRDSTGPDLWPLYDRESLEVSSQNVAFFFYRFYLSILQLYFNFDTVIVHQKGFTIPITKQSHCLVQCMNLYQNTMNLNEKCRIKVIRIKQKQKDMAMFSETELIVLPSSKFPCSCNSTDRYCVSSQSQLMDLLQAMHQYDITDYNL